jgi:hypothetical protein
MERVLDMTINDLGGIVVLIMAGVGTFCSTWLLLPPLLDFIDNKR